MFFGIKRTLGDDYDWHIVDRGRKRQQVKESNLGVGWEERCGMKQEKGEIKWKALCVFKWVKNVHNLASRVVEALSRPSAGPTLAEAAALAWLWWTRWSRPAMPLRLPASTSSPAVRSVHEVNYSSSSIVHTALGLGRTFKFTEKLQGGLLLLNTFTSPESVRKLLV